MNEDNRMNKFQTSLIALLLLVFLPAQVTISSNSWAMGAPMPTPREDPFVGVIGTKIYGKRQTNPS